jgi:hypothetical protein
MAALEQQNKEFKDDLRFKDDQIYLLQREFEQ